MPVVRDATLDTPTRPGAAPLLRRKRTPPAPAAHHGRTFLHGLLAFAIVVLTVDGFVGERGLVETMQARRQYHEFETSLERLQRENAELREQKRLLTDDPATIEGVAIEELGLIHPGETIFIIRDAKPAR